MTFHAIPLSKPAPLYLPQEPLWDSRADATDAWLEEMDPENETGAIATAYFSHERDHGQTEVSLIGLAVEEDGHTLFYTPAAACLFLSTSTVWRLEHVQFLEVNE